MEKNNSAKNFSYVGVGRFSAIIFQSLFYILFARLLAPELYGELSVVIALAGTFSIVSRLGMNISLQVYQAKNNSDISEQIKTLFLISTTVASLILLPINLFAAILCAAISIYIMTQQNLLGLRQYKKYMINTLIKSGLFFLVPILLFFILEIPGIVLGMAIASFIGSIPFFRNLKIISFKNLRTNFKVFTQNYIIDLSSLYQFIDKLLIVFLFGNFIVGVYQFNFQIYLAIAAFPGILSSYLISEESRGTTHKKISILVILCSICVSTLVVLFSPIIVKELFPKYIEGITALQIIALTIIPQSIAVTFGSKLIARESTKIGFVYLAQIGFQLIFIVFLGEQFGLVGLSLSILFSIIISLGMQFFLYKKTIALFKN